MRDALPKVEPAMFVEPSSVKDAKARIEVLRASIPEIEARIAVLNDMLNRDPNNNDDALEERVLLGRKKSANGLQIRSLRAWLANHGDASADDRYARFFPALRSCYRLLEKIQHGDAVDPDEIDGALDEIEYLVPMCYLDEVDRK